MVGPPRCEIRLDFHIEEERIGHRSKVVGRERDVHAFTCANVHQGRAVHAQRWMVSGCHGHQHGDHGGGAAVRFSYVDREGTAVRHGGAFGQPHDQRRVLGPGREDVVNGVIHGEDRPHRGQVAFVDADVERLDGRRIVLDGEGDVDALTGLEDGVLDIDAQQDGGMRRRWRHHG